MPAYAPQSFDLIDEVRVLLVDDEIKYLQATKTNLERAGFSVLTACDGVEALAVLRQTKVDIVVADVIMPNMHGLKLLSKIREDTTLDNLPFILHTTMMCLSEDDMYLEGGSIARKGSGIPDWALTKTPTPRKLIQFIEDVLGRTDHLGFKKWCEVNHKISQEKYDRWLAASKQEK